MLMPVIAAARTAALERLRTVAGEAVSQAAREELEEEERALSDKADEEREELSEKVEGLLDRE
jgi:diphthamide biosynthesis methyltransferase